jgi:hypothetical protein
MERSREEESNIEFSPRLLRMLTWQICANIWRELDGSLLIHVSLAKISAVCSSFVMCVGYWILIIYTLCPGSVKTFFFILPCNANCWWVVGSRFLNFQLWLSILSKHKHRCIVCSDLECNSTVLLLFGKWRLNREPTSKDEILKIIHVLHI